MAYPGDLNLIWIGVFDSREIRLNHVGLIRRKLVERSEGRLTRAQAQFPSQEVSKAALRRVVKIPEPFRSMVGWRIGISGREFHCRPIPADEDDQKADSRFPKKLCRQDVFLPDSQSSRQLKKLSFPGCSKRVRCKAPKILRSEAYLVVRCNDDGRGKRSRWPFFSNLLKINVTHQTLEPKRRSRLEASPNPR
jgi:hypothetical protein